jgi:hypothetical protein
VPAAEGLTAIGTGPADAALANGTVPEPAEAPGTRVSPASAAVVDAVTAMLADSSSGTGFFDPLGAADPVSGAGAVSPADGDPVEAAAATAPDRDMPSANGSEAAI